MYQEFFLVYFWVFFRSPGSTTKLRARFYSRAFSSLSVGFFLWIMKVSQAGTANCKEGKEGRERQRETTTLTRRVLNLYCNMHCTCVQ